MIITRRAGARLPALALALVLGTAFWTYQAGAVTLPAPQGGAAANDAGPRAMLVFSGGCFWGVQGVFQHVNGVLDATSGYAGGAAATAQYEVVSTGLTGHAESVRVTYDPRKVSLGTLLQVFFAVAHDPTEVNRQGPDEGTQYRSAIWTTNDTQAAAARAYIAQLNAAHVFGRPIATNVGPLSAFYPAEGYHQNYLTENPDAPYIVINDLPKVAALKDNFPTLYRASPVLSTVQ